MFYPGDWATAMQPALRRWVADALGVGWTAIWGRQQGPGATGEGPRPVKPWASIQALNLPDPAGLVRERVDVSPTQMDIRVRAPAEFVLEVQTFADDDQRAVVERMRAALLTQSVCDDLATNGLTPVIDAADVRDLSEVFAGEREFRHVLEIPFRVEVRETFVDQPFIQTIDPVVVQVTP